MILPKSNFRKGPRCAFWISILLIALTQTSCRPTRKSSRIIVASAGKITSLDPAQASTYHSLQIISALGDTLYKLGPNGLIKPNLAKALPQVNDEGLTITIPLREDVIFHDKTRFDAKAMAFSIRRFREIGTLNYILDGRIAAIETPEKFVLRLRLTRPSSSINGLLTSINLTPISPKAYKNYKDRFLNKKFIGTGPYKLVSFNSQQQILKPFDLYWGSPARNSGINFINLSNSISLFSAMKSGEVDVLLSNSIDEDQRHYLHKMSKQNMFKEGEGSAMEIGYITFLSNTPPLNQQILRKALTYSIDRNLISKRVSYGLRAPLRSLIPPRLKTIDSNPWPLYNPSHARFLFQKAGYCGTKKITVPLTFRSNVPADKLLALTWQAQVKRDLSDCLILSLNGVESTTIYRQLGEGAFQAVMLDWRGAYPDPEAYLSPFLSCKKINKNICEKGESVSSGSFWADSFIEKNLRESDQLIGTKRLERLYKVERIAAEGAAYLPIWLVKPRAWSQLDLQRPEFDASGQLRLDRLRKIK